MIKAAAAFLGPLGAAFPIGPPISRTALFADCPFLFRPIHLNSNHITTTLRFYHE